MAEPTFPTPVGKMKDIRLINGMNRILAFFDREAKANYCSGDFFRGWDWPTMRMIHSYLCNKYVEMKEEAIRRLEANNGILDGKQWEKTPKGWKQK